MRKFTVLRIFISLLYNLLRIHVTSNQICNHDNYKRIQPFLNQRWLDARDEMNLTRINQVLQCVDTEQSGCSKLKDTHDRSILTFFKFTSQAGVWNINGNIIAYCRIFKCANEGVSNNLSKYARMTGNFSRNVEPMVLNREDISSIKRAISYFEADNFTKRFRNSNPFHLTTQFRDRNSNFKMFTFIREPLQRFESGLTEAVQRIKGLTINSIANISSIIRDVILNYEFIQDYSKPLHRSINHIFPMSGVFFNFDIDITLHLESFLLDWENVIVPTYGLPPKTYNLKEGFHSTSVNHPRITSNDTNIRDRKADVLLTKANKKPTRHYFRIFKANDKHGMRALCHLLLIEYICFPEYALPVQCQFLNQSLLEGRSLLA